eukprot:scaffold447131_cov30-Prasinocladus_malaysianus.AAC.1
MRRWIILFLIDTRLQGRTELLNSCMYCCLLRLPFVSALRAFQSRTVFANHTGDQWINWCNGSLRSWGELPDLDHSCGRPCVVSPSSADLLGLESMDADEEAPSAVESELTEPDTVVVEMWNLARLGSL